MSARFAAPAVALCMILGGMPSPAQEPPGSTRALEEPAPPFPFVLPWDDASPSITNLSGWGHRPAGSLGPVTAGKDGRFYTGGKRIRFLGVNLCFSSCFPKPEDAGKIAARMAKFGINIVRFHHMDMSEFPGGIRARGRKDTRDLEPEALERLDHLIARLKENGIYVNLNLLVSRPFKGADGLPPEIERLGWKDGHVVGFFHAPMIDLQKEYARKLLAHRNPHTGLTYAEDPAVAFIEINNENGLLQGWLGGDVDRFPGVFQEDLRRQWNAWLKQLRVRAPCRRRPASRTLRHCAAIGMAARRTPPQRLRGRAGMQSEGHQLEEFTIRGSY